MHESTKGTILRVRPLSETSLIVHWLTAKHGRLSTVAKGARRTKSPLHGKIDLMFEAEFSFRRSRQSDLHILRELKILEFHPAIRKNIPSLQLLAYATHFIEQTTEAETPLLGIQPIFSSLLSHLDSNPNRPALVYALEMKLLNELGQAPALNECRLNDGTRKLLEQMTILDWDIIITLKPTGAQAQEAKQFLHRFLTHQFDKLPKGRGAALGE
jgi:DNA repair protein RecO (recombination protein O)